MPSKIRVFLVDDSDAFRQSAARFLSRQPRCELIGTASSGAEALEALLPVGSGGPDLVLLDVAMPGLNGLEVARRVKSRTAAPRIVMVTIHDDADYRTAARQAGADGFITKSDFTLQVVSLLHELCEQADVVGEKPE